MSATQSYIISDTVHFIEEPRLGSKEIAVGVDLGTSTIKASCENRKFVIPSVIGDPNPGFTGVSPDKTLESNLVVIIDNREHYVGQLAQLQSEVKRYLASEGRMKSIDDALIALKAALALVVEKEETVFVGTGVPVATSVSNMQGIARALQGPLHMQVRNEETGLIKKAYVNIKKCFVLPNSYGTYYYLLKSRGEEEALDTIIVDCGHGTTDLLVMYQGRPLRTSSGTMIEATDTLTTRLARALEEQTTKWVKPFDLMFAIRKGLDKVNVGGEMVDIGALKEHYVRQISEVITDEVARLLGTLPLDADVRYFIITGGGSHTFADEIKLALGKKKIIQDIDNVLIPDDPLMANAKGFEMIAKEMAKGKREPPQVTDIQSGKK